MSNWLLSRSKIQYICTRPGHVKLLPKFSLGPASLSQLVESETIKTFRISVYLVVEMWLMG